MRIDKFLKTARIIKRRQVAKAFCDANKVRLNDKVAKASETVKVGDQLSIEFGSRISTFRVLSVEEVKGKQSKDVMIQEI